MRQKDSEQKLDYMLKKYYSQKAPSTFVLREDEPTYKNQQKVFTYKKFLIPVCAVIMIALIVVVPYIFYGNSEYISPTNDLEKTDKNKFTITAYASQINPDTKKGIVKEITKNAIVTRGGVYLIDFFVYYNADGYYMSSGYSPMGVIEDGCYERVYKEIVGYHIGLNINGDNIDSFDVSADRGNFTYSEFNREFDKAIDFDVTPALLSGKHINDMVDKNGYDYGNTATGVKYDDKKSLFWFPDIAGLEKAIDDYAKSTVNVVSDDIYKTCKQENFDRFFGAQDEFFKKYKLSEYIDDTINITIHYNDKTFEKVKVAVKLDDDGNFVLDCK